VYNAVLMHDRLVRNLIASYGADKSALPGDKLVIVFRQPSDALRWCAEFRTRLLTLPWPPDLVEHTYCKEELTSEGVLLRKGLRVKMAVEFGLYLRKYDDTGMLRFTGPAVDRSAAVVDAIVTGGQVVISQNVLKVRR
jgi:adenylate cyclase